MTPSTTSGSMATDRMSFRGHCQRRHRPGCGHQSGTSVTGHARADRLLIRPTGGPGRCRQPNGQVYTQGTPKRPDRHGVTLSHRHRAWWFSTQEHRSDTDGPTFLRAVDPGGERLRHLSCEDCSETAPCRVPVKARRPGGCRPVRTGPSARRRAFRSTEHEGGEGRSAGAGGWY
jgi:hypothetical protein